MFYDEKFPNLRETVRYFKEDERGTSKMSTILEEYAKEYAKEVAGELAEELAKERAEELAEELAEKINTRFAIYMIKDGKSTSEIAEVTHLTEEEINSLRDRD